MSEAARILAARRVALLQRIALERQDLRDQAGSIHDTLGGLAHALSLSRLLGASPMLVGAGIALTLVVGRGRVGRTLGTAVAMVGLLRRYQGILRLAGQFVREIAARQSVRRSR